MSNDKKHTGIALIASPPPRILGADGEWTSLAPIGWMTLEQAIEMYPRAEIVEWGTDRPGKPRIPGIKLLWRRI